MSPYSRFDRDFHDLHGHHPRGLPRGPTVEVHIEARRHERPNPWRRAALAALAVLLLLFIIALTLVIIFVVGLVVTAAQAAQANPWPLSGAMSVPVETFVDFLP